MRTFTRYPARSKIGRQSHAPGRFAALVTAIALATLALVAFPAAPPAQAAVTSQCNGEHNGGDQGMECTILVENFLDVATGEARSIVTTSACSGGANVVDLPNCVGPTTTEYPELTTSANQCNDSANGGGASMLCSIRVINTITGGATASTAPINQCVGSLDTGDVHACNPNPATSDASVDGITQCNGSVNGGGGSITCTVDSNSTSNSEFAFLANQCNGSANGGGARIVCDVNVSTVIVPAAVVEPETEEPEGSDTPPADEAPPVDGAPPVVEAGPPTLPPTGAETAGLLGAAGLLLAFGLLGVIASRRTVDVTS